VKVDFDLLVLKRHWFVGVSMKVNVWMSMFSVAHINHLVC
jgi:hypothetical protein